MTRLSSSTQRIEQSRFGSQQPAEPVAPPKSTSRAGEDNFRRIDHAHDVHASQTEISAVHRLAETTIDPADRDEWLRLQARDLVEFLQRWSADLDARQAQLNSAMAQQDLRERQFRIQQRESQAELKRHQEAIEALRGDLSAQARRLAFQIR